MNTITGQGSPKPTPRTPNLKGFAVLQAGLTTNPYLTVSCGIVNFPQAGFQFAWADFQHGSFDVIPYSAGSNQSGTITCNVANIIVGQSYSIQILSGNGNFAPPQPSIIVVASTTSNADLAAAFAAAIATQYTGYIAVNYVATQTTIAISEVQNSTEGFQFIFNNAGNTFTQSVANTPSSGTVAEVNAWGGTQVTSGQFRMYVYSVLNTCNPVFDNMNENTCNSYVIFVDETANNFASVDTSLQSLNCNMSYLGTTYCQYLLGNLLSPPTGQGCCVQ